MKCNITASSLQTKGRKEKIYWLDSPSELPLEEKQHMQEARWDVQKPFSGSICQERVGKGERRRDTQGPGGQESSLGNGLCFSKSTVTLLRAFSSFMQPPWRWAVRTRGSLLRWFPMATRDSNIWLPVDVIRPLTLKWLFHLYFMTWYLITQFMAIPLNIKL